MSQNAVDEPSEATHKEGQESVSEQEALHEELKKFIIETLALEKRPEGIFVEICGVGAKDILLLGEG